MITLLDHAFDPADTLRAFQKEAVGAGAIVSFSGLVRPTAKSSAVTGLFLQAYSPMTERGIDAAANTAKQRWPLKALTIIHRVGEMQPGDPIVFVATAADHRRAAFEAADFLMDYLKTEAVFWKKETGPDGTKWIEPRAEDYQDRARWDEKEPNRHAGN